MGYSLAVQNGSKCYYPVVVGTVTWETHRKSSPGKLTFECLYDDTLNVEEGNLVNFTVDGKEVFAGYVFSISSENDEILSITCYDQLRYFKNKDSIIYTAKSATELLKMFASQNYLTLGQCDDTAHRISKDEDGATIFDIILNNLDETLMATGKLYCLWDDYGKLRMNSIASLVIPDLCLDADNGASYSYKTSIDGATYNSIKLGYNDDKTGKRKIYTEYDGDNINKWGKLQLYESINSETGAQEKVSKMLSLYNKKSQTLSLNGYIGDVRCRGGRSPIVKLKLRDQELSNYMLIESATHKFSENEHFMDLKVSGNYYFE
jgi:hypothetical protein